MKKKNINLFLKKRKKDILFYNPTALTACIDSRSVKYYDSSKGEKPPTLDSAVDINEAEKVVEEHKPEKENSITTTPSVTTDSKVTTGKQPYQTTVTIKAHTISLSSATNKTLVWTSSRPDIASVDSNEIVTAISPGKAIITVKTTDKSKFSASCMVTVN